MSRSLSNSVDLFFYLSSFQPPFAEIPAVFSDSGDLLVLGELSTTGGDRRYCTLYIEPWYEISSARIGCGTLPPISSGSGQ